MRPCILALLSATLCLAQGTPSNLDFEQGTPGGDPPGWFVPDALRNAGYKAVVTREGCRTGACALLTVPETRPPNTFGNLMSSIDATPYRGKRVVFRAAVRPRAAAAGGYALMWLRVDLTGGGMGFFDNMMDRPIRAGEWAFYEIRGTVDAGAQRIYYGVLAVGDVRVWVDDASLEFLDVLGSGPEVSAAREEIRKLYARLDSAYAAGDFDALKSIATRDARLGSPYVTIPLDQAVAQLKLGLGSASSLTYRTEIVSFDLTGDEAMVGARSTMKRISDGDSLTNEGQSSDTWVRLGGAWRLKKSIVTASREIMPPADPETTRAVAAELKKQAVPLATAEPGKPYPDLEAFGKAVGDARVVALGEATHGTREIFQMKHRLLEYLVKEKGFTVFAIEANWPESEAADRYIKTGEGDPKAALAAMNFWTWQTEEVLSMLEWMRDFNKAPGKHPILSFTSFDMQEYKVARDRVLAYCKQYAPQDLAAVESAYSGLARLERLQSDPGFDDAAKKADTVVALLETRRAALAKASSAKAFRDALQMARIVAQAAHLHASGTGPSYYRDQMMARNTRWLLDEAHPGEKIVLWAHNGHVSTARTAGYRHMGSWLRESLGPQMYVLGFAIHTGAVRAVTRENNRGVGLTASQLPPAPPGTGTATLSAAGHPLFFLDMKKQSGLLGKWLSERHQFRACGALWDRSNPESSMNSEALGKSYDGLIYLENTQAARGISR